MLGRLTINFSTRPLAVTVGVNNTGYYTESFKDYWSSYGIIAVVIRRPLTACSNTAMVLVVVLA